MSKTFASSDLEDISLASISFIFFCIMIVFLVIFSPGRDILRNHGIHWRNIRWTWKQNYCYILWSMSKADAKLSLGFIEFLNLLHKKTHWFIGYLSFTYQLHCKKWTWRASRTSGQESLSVVNHINLFSFPNIQFPFLVLFLAWYDISLETRQNIWRNKLFLNNAEEYISNIYAFCEQSIWKNCQ